MAIQSTDTHELRYTESEVLYWLASHEGVRVGKNSVSNPDFHDNWYSNGQFSILGLMEHGNEIVQVRLEGSKPGRVAQALALIWKTEPIVHVDLFITYAIPDIITDGQSVEREE